MKLTRKERHALAELAKPCDQRDYSGVHGHTIHALERKGLYGHEGKRHRKRVTAAGRAELKVPDIFDDLFGREIHVGCGGIVRLVGEMWRCDRCKQGPISVTSTERKPPSNSKDPTR